MQRLLRSSLYIATLTLLFPGTVPTQPSNAPIPSNPEAEFKANWGVPMINSLPVYLKGYTGKGIVDGDFAVNHPEFANRISDALGYFGDEDRHPANVNPTDISNGHGSQVSGIIGAARDGNGMQGVVYESTILPLLAVGVAGRNENVSPVDEAATYAINAGAKVLNGNYGPPEPLRQFFLTDENGDAIKDEKTQQFKVNGNYRQLTYQCIYRNPGGLADNADALKKAPNANIVLVFAAGNGAIDQPDGYSAIPSGPGMLPLITPENTKAGLLYQFINTTDENYNHSNPSSYSDWTGHKGQYVDS